MLATVTPSDFVTVWFCGAAVGSIATLYLTTKVKKFFQRKSI